jgi:hypothetical protein
MQSRGAAGIVHGPPTAPRVICIGNSLTSGIGGLAWPTYLAHRLGGRVREVSNWGKGGQQTWQMVAAYQAHHGGDPCIAVIWEIVNDMTDHGLAAMKVNYQTLCELYRNAGCKVIAATGTTFTNYFPVMPPKPIDAGTYANLDEVRIACNTWLKANWQTFADDLVDPDARFPNSNDLAYFCGDSIHFSTAGSSVVADLFYPAVDRQLTALGF